MSAPRRSDGVPTGLVVASEVTLRTAVVVLGALAVIWVVLELRVVTVPAFVALLATTVLEPPTAALRRRGWRPLLAAWTVLLTATAVVVGGISLLVPAFAEQTDELGARVEEAIEEIETWLADGPLGIEDPDLRSGLESAADQVLDSDPAAVIGGVSLAVEFLAGALVALVMVFFFVKDGPHIVAWTQSHLPDGRRQTATRSARAAWSALGAYVRGTLIVGVVNGTVIGVSLAVLGIPLALPLGVITAISAFFPLVGAVVAGALAALVALVTGGVVDALIVVGITVAVQQLEGDVLSPIVMGRALRLHPLVILVVLTAGATTAGLLGAFLAVPVTAMAVAAVRAARGANGDEPDVEPHPDGEPPPDPPA